MRLPKGSAPLRRPIIPAESISAGIPLPAAATRPPCGREGVQRSRARGAAACLRETASPWMLDLVEELGVDGLHSLVHIFLVQQDGDPDLRGSCFAILVASLYTRIV